MRNVFVLVLVVEIEVSIELGRGRSTIFFNDFVFSAFCS